MNDEIFDVEQSGPLTWFLVSFSPIVSSAHELSCFDRFAYTYRLVIGFPHYTLTYTLPHEPLLSMFNLPDTASLVSPWP